VRLQKDEYSIDNAGESPLLSLSPLNPGPPGTPVPQSDITRESQESCAEDVKSDEEQIGTSNNHSKSVKAVVGVFQWNSLEHLEARKTRH
jgi:hypothetical protein